MKETEKKEVDSNLQMIEMMKALRDQMNEMSALREQMKKMEVEKRDQEDKMEKERIEKAARKELKKEAALRKEKEEAEEKAKAKANPVISSGSDNESESGEEGQFNETPNEEEENNENEENQEDFEDSGEDAYTPVPSSEEEDQSEGEEDEDRADRLERKRKGKELRKEAKIAQKLSINMDIEQGKANLKIIEKAEQSIATKLEEAETKLLQEKESRYEKEEALKKKNQVLQKKYDIVVRTNNNEMAALMEKQKGKRAVFEESLAKEREELTENHKKSMNELEGEFNEKKKDVEGVEKLATEVKEMELECVILKKSREKKYEEKVKLEKRLAALSNKYESLSLRLQRERKIAKEQEAKLKEEGWSSVVARPKPSTKEEKAVSGPRKIPKHTLPQYAPKERYGEDEKIPCPSWLTRVAAGTAICPVGSQCPEVLRGCNLFHRDWDMLHAFVRGVRPVGWTEICEKNLRSEVDYWKDRKDHTFHKVIPEVTQLAPSSWNKKKDTEEEKENERQRIGRLVEGLSARKRNGPGGPAEGNRGGGRGRAVMANRGGRPHGNFMAQEQPMPPMGQFAAFRGRGNGQKRSGAEQRVVVKRGRGRGNGQAQRGAFVAFHNQRGTGGGYAESRHDEQDIDYEAVEFTGARK